MSNGMILLNPSDRTATTLRDIEAGEAITAQIEGTTYTATLREHITFSHKYVLHNVKEGAEILRYGLSRYHSHKLSKSEIRGHYEA